MSLRSDIMRFSVLGFIGDISIELQAPVIRLRGCTVWSALLLFASAEDRFYRIEAYYYEPGPSKNTLLIYSHVHHQFKCILREPFRRECADQHCDSTLNYPTLTVLGTHRE